MRVQLRYWPGGWLWGLHLWAGFRYIKATLDLGPWQIQLVKP